MMTRWGRRQHLYQSLLYSGAEGTNVLLHRQPDPRSRVGLVTERRYFQVSDLLAEKSVGGWRRWQQRLFDRDALGQVAWFIDIATTQQGDMV